MRKHLMIVLLLLGLSGLSARHTEYLIRTSGLKIASLEIDHDQTAKSVQFRIKSLNTTKLFPRLDNLYVVDYNSEFQPITYTRVIDQDQLAETVTTAYDRKVNTASLRMSQTSNELSYSIENASRDFFSFVLMVMQSGLEEGSFPIDGNGKSWLAQLKYLGDEAIRTSLGKFNTSVYEIRLRPQTEEKTPYIDMISHNILDPDLTIQLWVAEDKTTIKALAKKKLITTSIDLVKIGS